MTNLKENLDTPPEFGSLKFSVSVNPVSLQGSSAGKKKYKTVISEFINSVKYLLTGELKVNVEWMIHESERYESIHSPDIDNIIKPLLDAISGPTGLIIDDCQVQSITCHWIDWRTNTQRLNIEVQFIPDEFIQKDNLIFVHFGNGLYMPFQKICPKKHFLL